MARSGAAAVRTGNGWPVFFPISKKKKGKQRKKGGAGLPGHQAGHSRQDRHRPPLFLPDPGNEKDGEDADALLHHLGKGRDLYLFFSVIPAA